MTKREYNFMTNRQKDEALRLYMSGKTYEEIGGLVGIDPSRVGQLARKAGLPLRKVSDKRLTGKQRAAIARYNLVRERTRRIRKSGTIGK